MKRRHSSFLILTLTFAACDGELSICTQNDADCDGVPDDLGEAVDADGDGLADEVDIDGDGKGDGLAVDTDGDGVWDALGIDTNDDGYVDSIDLLDGSPIITTGSARATALGQEPSLVGSGGIGSTGELGSGGGVDNMASGGQGVGASDPSDGSGGAPLILGSGGASGGTGGDTMSSGGSTGGTVSTGCLATSPSPAPTTSTNERYAQADLSRGGVNYKLMANGWGDNFQNQTLKYTTAGTAFEVVSFNGSVGNNYSPAGYPTVFCGEYSGQDSGPCGLPRSASSLSSLQTGVRWSNANSSGLYNVAYDVWFGNGGNHVGFFMVWLHDPAQYQPAGSLKQTGVTVAGVPGTWDIWTGEVFNRPITNYVRAEGQDTKEISFDMKVFFNDSVARGYPLPGVDVMSVAIGFEIWDGPVSGLKVEDFCVDVK